MSSKSKLYCIKYNSDLNLNTNEEIIKEKEEERDPRLPPNTIVPNIDDFDPLHNLKMAYSIPIYNMAQMDYHIDPRKIENLQNMGFEYYQIIECLRAAGNDMNIAVEFLMNGIPNDEEDEAAMNQEGEENMDFEGEVEGELVGEGEMREESIQGPRIMTETGMEVDGSYRPLIHRKCYFC